jgi:hypothetical protein
MLVHPDKNMGSPLASESFKKLQCAYEVNINGKVQFYMLLLLCFLVTTSYMAVMELNDFKGVFVAVVVLLQFIMV